ncbi:hypothetical protein XNW1_4430004 [Xenorhabdus nematophila str. Websteri]|nr:hypothetical protein XNW1_4430004 [Xenorhabdus nematophila str. Websteri]
MTSLTFLNFSKTESFSLFSTAHETYFVIKQTDIFCAVRPFLWDTS